MKKKLTITALFIIMLSLILTTGVYAYQSIPTGTSISAGAGTWITGIRQMESAGQGMGLNETIDTTGLATSTSNNIDVHMLKNTEYGAIVLLGASDYGKQGAGTARYMNSGATTTSGTDVKASSTGNVYGIYELGYYNMNVSSTYYEWVAGGISQFASHMAPRYRNVYTTSVNSARVGDASYEDGTYIGNWQARSHWLVFWNLSWYRTW